MNTTVLSLSLSLIIGFVLGSPLELRALEDGIVPSAEINYRLSSDVVPIRYVLHITPYFVDVSKYLLLEIIEGLLNFTL